MSTEADSKVKLGYREYALYPDDGRRHEIVDGEHYMNPSPGTYHQTVSKRLQYALYTQIELAGRGVVFDAPIDVQLAEHDIVQPDLIAIASDRVDIVTPKKVLGVPNLLIEILSPTTIDYDRVLKKAAYLRNGVPEYWIVDPIGKTIEQNVLAGGKYSSTDAGGHIQSTQFAGVSIALADIW